MSDKETGPIYGVELLNTLPIGGMIQAMPSRVELECVVRRVGERTVAAYEVLTSHYRKEQNEVARLKALIRSVIDGKWEVTSLQEAIGDV